MQAGLHEQWSVAVALKRRPELKDGFETWMEIYSQIPEDFPVALESAVQNAGLLTLTEGGRHIETFIDISTCA